MGARGKPPMPTALRVLTGDRNKDRYNPAEPEPTASRVVAPDDLSDEVRAIWDSRLKWIEDMGLAYPCDGDAWRAFCESVAIHQQACRDMVGQSLLVPGERGMVKNPLIQIQRDASLNLLRFAVQFGLTPSARSSIMTAKKREDIAANPFADTPAAATG